MYLKKTANHAYHFSFYKNEIKRNYSHIDSYKIVHMSCEHYQRHGSEVT